MKVTKKELTRITVFPPVHIPLPGTQTAYIIVNLEEILSETVPSPQTCPSTSIHSLCQGFMGFRVLR